MVKYINHYSIKLGLNGPCSAEIINLNYFLLPQINQELCYQFQRADNWGVKLGCELKLPSMYMYVAERYCTWSRLQCSIIDLSHVTMIHAPLRVWEQNYKLCVQTSLWCENYPDLLWTMSIWQHLEVFDIKPTPKLRVQNLPDFTKSWLIPRISILHILHHC